MSAYRLAFLEAITAMGLKKAVSELLSAGGVMGEKDAGQVLIHINNGGATKICLNNWEVKA